MKSHCLNARVVYQSSQGAHCLVRVETDVFRLCSNRLARKDMSYTV